MKIVLNMNEILPMEIIEELDGVDKYTIKIQTPMGEKIVRSYSKVFAIPQFQTKIEYRDEQEILKRIDFVLEESKSHLLEKWRNQYDSKENT